MHKYLIVLSVLLGVILFALIATSPITSYSFERSDASPVGTAIDAPTPTDCPRCEPVGTAVYAPTDTPAFGH